VPRRSGGES